MTFTEDELLDIAIALGDKTMQLDRGEHKHTARHYRKLWDKVFDHIFPDAAAREMETALRSEPVTDSPMSLEYRGR